jgi:nucleoside-diphosphate-sugar epimerase
MPDSVDFSRKPVLVLGASGFIGSRVVAALASSAIYRPVAASRHSAVALDATKIDAMRVALRDMHYVVNCIAGSERVMVRSTQILCEAARLAAPRRIIHLSSMAVYGDAIGTIQENHPPLAPISGYGKAKIECERIIREFIDDGGDAVILRPTCVFGTGSPQWTTRLMRLLRSHRIGDLGTEGDGCCNLAFIDDVVAGVVAALDAADASGRTFNLSSSSDLTWNQFLVLFGTALGATPIRRISPRRLRIETKLLAPASRIASRLVRLPAIEAITPSLAALWRQDIRIDCTAAQMTFALPRATPDQMIAAVVRNEGVMKEPVLS